MIDISGLSAAELSHLRMQIDHLLKIKHAERIANARRDIIGIAREIGVSVEELMERPDTREKPLNMPVRIEHPSVPGRVWSGRGRHPNWMKELLAAGKSLDELKAT